MIETPHDFDELFGAWVFPDALAGRVVAVTNLGDATELARNICLPGVEAHHRVASQEVVKLRKIPEMQRN